MAKRSFMATTADLRQGRTQDELTEALGQLVQAVQATGRGGKLVFTLAVSPAAKDSNMVKVTGAFDVKAPKADVAETLMFATTEGSLQLENPDAPKAQNMRAVDATAPVMRSVEEVAHG